MKTTINKNTDALRDGADAHIGVVDSNGETLAACSLWWRSTPRENTGVLGHFEASCESAAAGVLASAEEPLREAGCESAIGPMDGNTWRSYRLVTKSNGRAPFLLEPQNPPEWPEHFLASGWQPLARYTSSEIDLGKGAGRPAVERVARRLESAGVTIRNLRADQYADELARIYDVSVISFRDNFLYTPLSREHFIGMYSRVEELVSADYVMIAEDRDARPAGFVFALPDSSSEPSLIVKTLAVLPERRYGGLGSLLVERVHQAARENGFTRAIHALQHQNNSSLKISSRHAAEVFREYTLFERGLA